MKHTSKITFILIAIFIFSQIIGLLITSKYINYQKTAETGEITYEELPFDMERPDVEESTSYIYILIGVLLGTGLLLLIIKFKRKKLWKLWYFIGIVTALTFAFSAFTNQYIALILSIILTALKIFRPNVIIHNISELFIYGGLAALIVPILNIQSAIILLILISVYDMIAVWKLKHMISLAEFQTKEKLFAGLYVPYNKNAKSKIMKKSTSQSEKQIKPPNKQTKKTRTAILGGGDIAFPLLFAGAVMKSLIQNTNNMLSSFLTVLIIVASATTALSLLFYFSKEKKYYPAMPFISLGCFAGYLIILMI